MEKQKFFSENKTLKRFEYLFMLGICLILYICIMELIDSSRLYFWRSIFVIASLTYIIHFVYEQMLLDNVRDRDAINRSNQRAEDFAKRKVAEAELQLQRDKNLSEISYYETDAERSAREQKEYEKEQARLNAIQWKKINNFAETGYYETDAERSAREQKEYEKEQARHKFEQDDERVENFKKFGKELTNKEILDEFEKQNIYLDFETKTRIENQLNGLTSILELPYEIDVIRKKQFKYLNDIGVWYDIKGRRIVKFPKSEKFWKDAGGRDATRGFDDWASK